MINGPVIRFVALRPNVTNWRSRVNGSLTKKAKTVPYLLSLYFLGGFVDCVVKKAVQSKQSKYIYILLYFFFSPVRYFQKPKRRVIEIHPMLMQRWRHWAYQRVEDGALCVCVWGAAWCKQQQWWWWWWRRRQMSLMMTKSAQWWKMTLFLSNKAYI